MFIWLASYPRSGNTFFRALLHTVFSFPTLSVYNETGEPLDQTVIGNAAIDKPADELLLSKELYFRKTHGLPEEDDDNPAIYLVRDGRDALVSYARFAIHDQEDLTEPMNDGFYLATLQHMITSNDYFGGWSQNVEAWMNRKTPTAVVKFEDLITSPLPTLQRAFTELVGARRCLPKRSNSKPNSNNFSTSSRTRSTRTARFSSAN